MRVLIGVIMGRWSEFSACIVCQVVRLYSVVDGDRTLPCQAVLQFSLSATLIVQLHIEPPTGQHGLDYST